jgi:hypothetical protein
MKIIYCLGGDNIKEQLDGMKEIIDNKWDNILIAYDQVQERR